MTEISNDPAMTFDSYHWHDSRTGTPELERARNQLATKQDRAAFELLLRSDDPVGIGVALDQFHYADASTRHGTSNPFEEYHDEVVARARKVLRAAPSAATNGTEEGANHASALGALMNLAEQEDTALIVGALEQARTSNVRLAAVYAGSTVLENSSPPDENLIAAIEQSRLMRPRSSTSDERQSLRWAARSRHPRRPPCFGPLALLISVCKRARRCTCSIVIVEHIKHRSRNSRADGRRPHHILRMKCSISCLHWMRNLATWGDGRMRSRSTRVRRTIPGRAIKPVEF